jgi:hypothetical protein
MDIKDLKNKLLENTNNLEEGKTNELYKLLEKVYEDAIDGVDYDENYGFSSKSFQDYWKENQGEIMVTFRKI